MNWLLYENKRANAAEIASVVGSTELFTATSGYPHSLSDPILTGILKQHQVNRTPE
jgi:hypothetical protein